MIELKDYEHDYYCSDSNYYSNSAGSKFDTWKEFYDEFYNSDIDMNLIFRFDIRKSDSGLYYMEVFMIHQRKGIFAPILIRHIVESDMESIERLLSDHWEKLKSIWNPISNIKEA